MSRSSRSSSRARPASVVPSGTSGAGASSATRGLAVEVGAERLDRGLEPHARLGLVDLGPVELLARLGALLLERGPLRPQGVEALARRSRRFRLAPPPLAQPVVDGLDLGQRRGQALLDRPVGARSSGERRAPLLGFGVLGRVAARQSGVDALEPAGQHGPPLGEGGDAHLEVAAHGGDVAGAPVELGYGGVVRGLRVSSTSADGFEPRDGLGPSSLRRGARGLGGRGFGGGVVERGLGHRRCRPAAEAPRARTAEAVAVAGDDDEVGVGEHEVERGPPSAVDEHDAGEEPLEHRAEAGRGAPARSSASGRAPAGTTPARAHRPGVRRRRARARARRRP